MQRVFRWVDVDGTATRGGGDRAYRWPEAGLRPTGLVVFATLERPRGEPVRRAVGHARLDPAWAPTSRPERGGAPPRLRPAARRAVDWLLGR